MITTKEKKRILIDYLKTLIKTIKEADTIEINSLNVTAGTNEIVVGGEQLTLLDGNYNINFNIDISDKRTKGDISKNFNNDGTLKHEII